MGFVPLFHFGAPFFVFHFCVGHNPISEGELRVRSGHNLGWTGGFTTDNSLQPREDGGFGAHRSVPQEMIRKGLRHGTERRTGLKVAFAGLSSNKSCHCLLPGAVIWLYYVIP